MPRPPKCLPPDSLFDPVLDDHGGLDSDTMRAAEKMAEWGKKKPRSKPKSIPDAAFARAKAETERMMATGDWSHALPRHFVALYARLHEHVYGIPPSELGPAERLHAAQSAARMLDTEFEGNAAACATFMRWCWQREHDREKWRRENNQPGRRILWRLQFGGGLLTDFRLELARKRKAT